MFLKLLKWEFGLHKKILFLYLVAALSFISLYAVSFVDSLLLQGIFGFITVVSLIFVAAGTLIILIMNYYKTMYGQESYLLHTIPVKSSHVYYSKIIVASVYSMISTIILTAGPVGIVATLSGRAFSSTASTLLTVIEAANMNIETFTPYSAASFWTFIITWTLISIVFSQIQYMGIISLAMGKRLQKFGVPGIILTYVVVYTITQIVVLLLVLLVPLAIELRLDPSNSMYNLDIAVTKITEYQSGYDPALGLPSKISLMPLVVFITPLIPLFWFLFTRNQVNKHKNII